MIYVNGDSWTWEHLKPYDKLWPSIVSKKLGMDYVNEAMGGGSNSRIVEKLENFYICSEVDISLIIVALTTNLRWHMPSKNFGTWNINIIDSYTCTDEHTGDQDNTLSKFFVTKSYDEVDSMFRYYKHIWSIHEMAKKMNCPCAVFQAFDHTMEEKNILESEETIKYFLSKHYKKTDIFYERYYHGFRSLLNYKQSWNYYESPLSNLLSADQFDNTRHPTPAGQQVIGDFIYEKVKKLF